MQKNFGNTLKKLIKFTNTKLNAIAYFIDYDISYVSKWSNNSSQPSKKHIERISNKLSLFFAQEILEKDIAYLFLKEFHISEPLPVQNTAQFLQKQINNLLNNAYYCTQTTTTPVQKDEPAFTVNSHTIIGRTNIYDFFCNKLTSIINQISPKLEIFMTIDILTLLQQKKFFTFFNACEFSNKQVDIHIGCNIQRLSNCDEKLIYRFYKFLNKFLYVNFYIYDDTTFENSNIFLVPDSFAIQYSLHHDKSIDICTFITQKNIVAEIGKRIKDTFEHSAIMLQPQNSIVREAVHPFFYLNKNFIIFNTNGFEFFLSNNSFKKMIQYYTDRNLDENAINSIKNLQIMWEEQFEKSPISFILPEFNLMNYVQSGDLIYGDFEYKTSSDEREEQLRHLIDCMFKNPLINITLISQQENISDMNYFKLSYYSNQKVAYFKKNKYVLKDYHAPIYLLKNSLLIHKFDAFFTKLKDASFAHSYSAETLNELYTSNKSLLNRIMQEK